MLPAACLPRRARHPYDGITTQHPTTPPSQELPTMKRNTITTADGTQIYFKDWGDGPVDTFSHGWPLNSDAWDGQLRFLASKGFRDIAHDRRGMGGRAQPATGKDMRGYADDLAQLIETVDLRQITMVGHSTGGGEGVRHIARHGNARVARAVFLGAVPPVMVKSAANPD